MRNLPVIPTIIVAAAIATMLALGFWQLERRAEKTTLKAAYSEAVENERVLAWPALDREGAPMLYRRARLDCVSVDGLSSMAGKNAAGRSGLAITAQCRSAQGAAALVVLGWSSAPELPDWRGGEVVGRIAPGPRLVADPPLAGLEANALPDPADLPDNHLAYAVQWFLFALVAAVIYWLALRKRLAAGEPRG